MVWADDLRKLLAALAILACSPSSAMAEHPFIPEDGIHYSGVPLEAVTKSPDQQPDLGIRTLAFEDRFNETAVSIGLSAVMKLESCKRRQTTLCHYAVGQAFSVAATTWEGADFIQSVYIRPNSAWNEPFDRELFLVTADLLIATVKPDWPTSKRQRILRRLTSSLSPKELFAKVRDDGIVLRLDATSRGLVLTIMAQI
jgi:hypothetical protein